jgi:DNA replication and repair protein RecF
VWVEELEISQWRNHVHTTITCEPGITLFIGPNGQGKTNVVEALYFLSTLSSHRVSGNQALIADGCSHATVHARLRLEQRSVQLGVTIKRKGASEAIINQSKAKLADVPHWVSTVMFAPEDAAIVRGEPGGRRTFMDQLVTSAQPVMAGTYQDFDRVLKQRNSLLKTLRGQPRSANTATLQLWDQKFAELGARIMVQRHALLAAIMPFVTDHYSHLAGGDQVNFEYLPQSKSDYSGLTEGDEDAVRQQLLTDIESKRSEERERGVTLLGPQRDDVELTIADKPARTHASQGETWSLALALRLATAQWLRQERSSGDPVIILDDVFAELDSHRRTKLLTLVSDYTQLMVTSAVEEDLPAGLTGQIFDVSAGVATKR